MLEALYLLGRDSAQARTYYGVDMDYNAGSQVLGINGDDAIELFYDGVLIDTYGNADEKGGDWTYTDGWAHRRKMGRLYLLYSMLMIGKSVV